MNWKEQFDAKFDTPGTPDLEEIENFIQTEIIEKLIADIHSKDFWNIPREEFDNKVQQLRKEWV